MVLDGTVSDGVIFYMENEQTADWSSTAGQSYYNGYGYLLRDATTPSDGLSRGSNHGIPWSLLQTVASDATAPGGTHEGPRSCGGHCRGV